MNYEYFIKRNKTTLQKIISENTIESAEQLISYFNKMSVTPPELEHVQKLFEVVNENVEERSAVKSSTKKKRVSSQKSIKRKTDDSSGSGRSRSAQRSRKSSNKPQRKSDSGKVESVQPASGSESSK